MNPDHDAIEEMAGEDRRNRDNLIMRSEERCRGQTLARSRRDTTQINGPNPRRQKQTE